MSDNATLSEQGFELLASGNGQRLERWNDIVVQRPESSATWPWKNPESLPAWQGHYDGLRAMGGRWQWIIPLPDPCIIRYQLPQGSLRFQIKPTASKHLGLFPEQAPNWAWIQEAITAVPQLGSEPPRLLNLFGYTGGATLAAAAAGAAVTHVDASRAMVTWCSENAKLSGLESAQIRYVVEDTIKYLQREIRRGSRYEAIIMDPPSFGRGKGGELWKLSEHLPLLLELAREVLSENPRFLLLNTYSDLIHEVDASPGALIKHIYGSTCKVAALSLRGRLDGQSLPCGISYRWQPLR